MASNLSGATLASIKLSDLRHLLHVTVTLAGTRATFCFQNLFHLQ